MIKIEKTEVVGWEAAIRGMRNPLRSWQKSDSKWGDSEWTMFDYEVGPNDLDLMTRLAKSGSTHRKYLRMIVVYVDVTAPQMFWSEADTYKVGTVANSESKMHTITKREFTIDDFSHDTMTYRSRKELRHTIDVLNEYRNIYLNGGTDVDDFDQPVMYPPKSKIIWRQIIDLLPESYLQKRTLMLNYEVLTNIYHTRKNHKLEEWEMLCEWIESLPYSELITGGFVGEKVANE